MEAWHQEIVELHEFFEGYFLGAIGADDVGRLEAALTPEFTIVGPGGRESTRAQTVAAIREAHAHTSQLKVTITDARLLVALPDVVIARYVEHHEVAGTTNERVSTVVFDRASDAPNGVRWRTVHETWLPTPQPSST